MRRSFPSTRNVQMAGLAVLVVCAGAPPAADAQGFGWFGNLFGGGAPRPSPGAPVYPGYGRPTMSPYDGYASRPRRTARRPRTLEQVQRERQPKNASSYVYVFGGSLGQSLANGLDEALADRQDVAVLHRARAGTGLDDPDAFNWLKTVDEALDAGARTGDTKHKAEHVDVGVVMIGSDDRGPIEENGKTLEFGSPAWTAAYSKRVGAIDEAFKRKGIPLVWVGLPITKNDDVADDTAALNDIYRDVAAKDGATYVDSWEAFSDDDGDFAANGPDISGRTVRLRAPDGIGFTRAGARKLAHFVELHVRRALDGKTGPAAPDQEPAPVAATTGARAKPTSSAVENLGEPPLAAGATLVSVPKPAASTKPDVAGPPDVTDTGAAPDAGANAGPPPAPAPPSGVAVEAADAHDTKTPRKIPTERADNPVWHPDAQP